MHKRSLAVVGTVGVLTLLLATQALAASANSRKVLLWDTMVGIPTALTGTNSQGPLRGIDGGGLPWAITSGKGQLTANGHLMIKVTGLVISAGPLAGTNPISSFKGLVSCVNADGTITNVLTDAFPASTGPATSGGGNSKIDATVTLPNPCIAPIVFVTSPGGAWFAATGQ